MGDDKCRSARAQRPKPILDERLAFAVKARSGFVEDEKARIREDRPRNRDPLPLAAREAHAAFADDRVITLFERFDELIAMRDPADGFDVLAAGVRPRVRDVLRDG